MNAPRAVYLDHHATTPVDPRVLDAMLPFFTSNFGNASSSHVFGRVAANAVELARRQVADLLHVDARTIVFTSGATEANNLAVSGVMSAGDHLLTTNTEHRALIDVAKQQEVLGRNFSLLAADSDARVSAADVEQGITPDTRLASVIFVNNEVGAINPLAEIAAKCRRKGVLLHTDASQAVGRIDVHPEELGVDLLSLTAHKIYGPKGIGALYVRRTSPPIAIQPMIHGGGHERGLRSGTLPVPLIVGFGTACEIAGKEMAEQEERCFRLREQLWTGLRQRVPDVVRNTPNDRSIGSNLSVSVPNVDGEALHLGLHDVAVSAGSACSSRDPEPSHVLRAMGVGSRLARASFRFGLGRFTTTEEIGFAIERVVEAIQSARQL